MSFPSVDDRAARTAERAQRIAGALADAARRARQTRGSSSSTYRDHRPWWVRHLPLILFIGIAALPSVLGAAYYSFVASDQFVAEARFTVRNGEIPKIDALGALTGIQAVTVVQDTQIVTNYIQSRAMVERLEHSVGLRRVFGNEAIDIVSRFRASRPVERLVDYWRSMTDVSIQLPSGIVTVSVRAFTAADAVAVAAAVVAESERLVNDMNERMRADAVASAQAELLRARDRLTAARQAMERGRNAEGLLDAGRAGEGLGQLLQGLRTDRLALQQEIDTQSHYVAVEAPQMQSLRARLGALDDQIRQLESRLTKTDTKPVGENRPLSAVMTGFDERAVELGIAEKHYASAFASLELARTLSEGKHVYLNAFVRPTLPQDADYPRRLLLSCAIAAASCAAWAAATGAVSFARARWA